MFNDEVKVGDLKLFDNDERLDNRAKISNLEWNDETTLKIVHGNDESKVTKYVIYTAQLLKLRN